MHIQCYIIYCLLVLAAVVPVLQPGWFPFELQSDQLVISPDIPPVVRTVDLREFKELVFSCRVDGKPKGVVTWLYNEVPIDMTTLPQSSYDIFEVVQGRSVLVFDLFNFFNETGALGTTNGLLGTNRIQCIGSNEAGNSLTGEAIVMGESKKVS